MSTPASLPFLSQPLKTFFNKQTNIKDYLIGQTAFSTALGFFVCRLPFFQSAALGLATEGSRYVTDKAIAQLSAKFSFIENNRTVVKTALVAGSFFLAKAVINTILPGSSTLFRAGLLMSAIYLVAEPIATTIRQACTKEGKTVKQSLIDIKNDIGKQYPIATQKINDLWNRLVGNNS
ncbi:hypothetical protein RHABOEDO_001156 [Candidatus Rhabdochlamydia oedothoracis]|uniref:Uncharacterized protein n=1 Tax=Candidatus Rhabdochlamydia oedothoracis TaxID=2720720 RepID=A0ABX8V106_9BACT|nr:MULTISPECIES: hypothetical protein [Rhabdochlamydia]KAG6559301.1 hypothetical protein RHOW815_000691 [Candidatus Rhabdochlamydia sp. W815]QYF48917.1 hypothetical protein RHABOEDO_001156 [Candidatus Rhabdochlamydia oedothoracis]